LITEHKFRIIFFSLIVLFIPNHVFAEEFSVSIPFGAFNPELNTPAEVWYDPPTISVQVDDTITWSNDDREGHTVTSGVGSGRFGWMSDDFGMNKTINEKKMILNLCSVINVSKPSLVIFYVWFSSNNIHPKYNWDIQWKIYFLCILQEDKHSQHILLESLRIHHSLTHHAHTILRIHLEHHNVIIKINIGYLAINSWHAFKNSLDYRCSLFHPT